MLGDSGLSQNRANIVKIFYEENIDISSLNNLKRHLLDSKQVEGNLLPISEYNEIKSQIYKDRPLKLEEFLLQEIRVGDKYIDLGKLVEVIDICNFFPVKVKKIKNKSSDIYCILSSNMRDNFDVKESSNGGI
jgi:hypothetical protein